MAYPTFDPWHVMPPDAPPPQLSGDTGRAPSICQGGEPARPLTLHQAVEFSVCHNPQARQAWATALSQAAQYGQSWAGFLPTVSISLNKSRDEITTRQRATMAGQAPLENDSVVRAYGRNLTLSYVLLDFGARAANVTQARHLLEAALASHDATLQAVFSNAAQTYYEALATRAAMDAARDAEAAATESFQAAQAREAAGSGYRAEVLQAKSLQAQAVAARIKADGAHRQALGGLASIMGLDARAPLELDPQAGQDASPGSPEPGLDTGRFLADLDHLMDQALREHPSVRAAEAQLAAASARLDAVAAEGQPSLSLSIGRYINGRPNTPLSPVHSVETLSAVTLSVPLFEGFARNYKVREARAQVESRRADVAIARSQASLDAWRNYQALQSETASLAASVDVLQSGQEAYDVAQARYRSGDSHIVEVLDAQKDLANARQERIRALAAWRTARLRLLASLGRVGFWALDTVPSDPCHPTLRGVCR
jgi:outer membrane protein